MKEGGRFEVATELLLKHVSTATTKYILRRKEELAFAFDFPSRSDLGLGGQAYASLLQSHCIEDTHSVRSQLERIPSWDSDEIMELIVSHIYHPADFALERPDLVEHLSALVETISGCTSDPISDDMVVVLS